MPLINPDTSGISELGAIPAGTYKAKIVEVTPDVSKASGNPMIVVKYEVDVEGKPRARKAYHVITGEGAYGFDQLLRATGFEDVADKYKAKEGEKPAFDTDQLVGQEVNVIIEADSYQGQLRDKIRSYLKA